MEVLHPRCAGLDVHKETVVACVRIASGGEVSRAVRTFETTTTRLIELAEWLEANGCTHAAMEATGVYWKPVWQVLAAGGFELVLANAAHVKNVPGCKTDVNNASRTAGAWADPGELRAGAGDPGAARAAAHAQAAGAREGEPCAAPAEDAGGSQHKAGVGSVRRHGPQRPGDDPSADRRRDRPCQASRARASQGPGAASKPP